jgi:hypothetical protein
MQTAVDRKTIKRLFRAMESKGIVLLREVLLNQNAPGVGSIAIIGSLVSPTGERYDEHTVLQRVEAHMQYLVGDNFKICSDRVDNNVQLPSLGKLRELVINECLIKVLVAEY